VTTLIFTHPDCFAHDTGPGHPEAPERLAVVWDVLDRDEFKGLERRPAPEADVGQLARVHDRAYVDSVLAAMPARGYHRLDGDTLLSPGSRGAILRAAGSVCAAVDAVMAGEATNAFCAVRPCGHHAEPARAMGFCVFNNIAVGALHARDPLAQLGLTAADFEWVTRKLVEVADRQCGGRIVSVLEGGYDAAGLAEGCAAHLRALRRA